MMVKRYCAWAITPKIVGGKLTPDLIETLIADFFGSGSQFINSKTVIIHQTMPCKRLYAYSFESFPRKTPPCRCGENNCFVVWIEERK